MKKYLILIASALLALSCGAPSVPQDAASTGQAARIYPDYTGVTIPCNIAPLNFMSADSTVTQVVARITSASGQQYTYGQGNKVIIPADEWTEMLQASLDADLSVELYSQHQDQDGWAVDKPFRIHVSPDSIDPYVAYRLIEPAYGMYDRMNISQRCLQDFDEREIFNNQVACDDKKGQCINCHSFQNYHTQNMLFHVRVTHGGTVMVHDGQVTKLDLKREGMISAGVYPAWHPTLPLVAFSTDNTHQYFHTRNRDKVEVFDDASDLILYDVQNDRVSTIAADTTRMEVFPTWTPDGQWLYYCSTDVWTPDTTAGGDTDFRFGYVNQRYNLYRRHFNSQQLTFGPEELVYQADSLGRSVSLPRISPDGRFLTFAEGHCGYFNIWHHDADVRIMRIADGQLLSTRQLCSTQYADSYPSFSSNGRWVMCASRRDDGNYSRIYISYFDGKQTHKAFLLPQRDPEHNTLRLLSYNRPEFTVEPVQQSITDFSHAVLRDGDAKADTHPMQQN